jgi:acetolactate synthase I/II/III large subunit
MIEEADEIEINDFSNWVELLRDYREKEPLRYIDSNELIKPQWVIEKVGKILGDNAIVSTDVGQHQMWTAQFFPFSHPRQWITSGGLGTMGFGLPAALGAARAFKDSNRVVVNFTGDGSILMNIQELMTCVEYELPVINIILNNNYLGMVRQWQTMFYDNRLSETDLTKQPDFPMLCKAFGGLGYRVGTKDEFEAALKDAVEQKKTAMIEVIVARNEEVLPMVPNGHSLNEMTLLKGDR